MKNVIIICNQGMSSSVMAKKTTNLFKERGEDILIEATTIAAGGDVITSDKYDLILISPQIRMKFDEYKALADKENKKIAQISFEAYAPISTGIEAMAKIIEENI